MPATPFRKVAGVAFEAAPRRCEATGEDRDRGSLCQPPYERWPLMRLTRPLMPAVTLSDMLLARTRRSAPT